MNDRENRIRAYMFNKPERIPIKFIVSLSCWENYEISDIEKLMVRHKLLFPDFKEKLFNKNNLPFLPYHIKGVEHTDSWGCVWKTNQNGITGAVIKHSLDHWEKLRKFIPPNPSRQNGWFDIDWELIKRNIITQREKDEFIKVGLRHGYLFLTMSYMRGYENLLFDMFDENPNLDELIKMIEDFNRITIDKFLSINPDMIDFPEDLGSQQRFMLSPKLFNHYIKPVYKRLMKPVKEAGKLVHMHTDGYIMDIVDDLIECGVDVINPQDLVNGIDNIQKIIMGRMAINLDIDRQNVTVYGSITDIDDLIKEEVIKLGSEEGGLSLIYALHPGTPLKNAEALMTAMEKYSLYYS